MRHLIKAAFAALILTLTAPTVASANNDGGSAPIPAPTPASYTLDVPAIDCGETEWNASVTVDIPYAGLVSYQIDTWNDSATTIIGTSYRYDASNHETFTFGPFPVSQRFKPFTITATWNEGSGLYVVHREGRPWEAFEPVHNSCPVDVPAPTVTHTCGQADVLTIPAVDHIEWYDVNNDWTVIAPGTYPLQPGQTIVLIPGGVGDFVPSAEVEYTFTGAEIETCPTNPPTTTVPDVTTTVPVTNPPTTAAPTTTQAPTTTAAPADTEAPTTTAAPATTVSTTVPPTVAVITPPQPTYPQTLPHTGSNSGNVFRLGLYAVMVGTCFVLLAWAARRSRTA